MARVKDLMAYMREEISTVGRNLVLRVNTDGRIAPTMQVNEDIIIGDDPNRKLYRSGSIIILDENNTPSLVSREECARSWNLCDSEGKPSTRPYRDEAAFVHIMGIPYRDFYREWQKRYENTETPHAAENIYRWDLGHFHDEIREMMREQRDHVEIEARVQSAIADLQALKIHPGMDRLPEIRDAVSQMELALSEFLDNGADTNALFRLSQTNASIIRMFSMFSMYEMSEKERTERYILLENTRNLLSDRRNGFDFPDLGDLCHQIMESVPPQYREKAAAYRAEAREAPDRRSNQGTVTGKGAETTAVADRESITVLKSSSQNETLHLLTELGGGRLLYMSEYAAEALLDMRQKMVFSPDNPDIQGALNGFRARVIDTRNGSSTAPEIFSITRIPADERDQKPADVVLRLCMQGESMEIPWSKLEAMLRLRREQQPAQDVLEEPQEPPSLWSRMISFRNRVTDKIRKGLSNMGDVLDNARFSMAFEKIRLIDGFRNKVEYVDTTRVEPDVLKRNYRCFTERARAESRLDREDWECCLKTADGKLRNSRHWHDAAIALDDYCLNNLWAGQRGIVEPLFRQISSIRDYVSEMEKASWYVRKVRSDISLSALQDRFEECIEGMANALQDIEFHAQKNRERTEFGQAAVTELKEASRLCEDSRKFLELNFPDDRDLKWFREAVHGFATLEENITERLKNMEKEDLDQNFPCGPFP